MEDSHFHQGKSQLELYKLETEDSVKISVACCLSIIVSVFSFMFELMAKCGITSSTKANVLELLEKLTPILASGELILFQFS